MLVLLSVGLPARAFSKPTFSTNVVAARNNNRPTPVDHPETEPVVRTDSAVPPSRVCMCLVYTIIKTSKMAEPTRDTDANVAMIRQMALEEDHQGAVSEFYDKWAEHYEEDVEKKNYNGPAACAEAFSKVMSDKTALIVDCGAGTGKAGLELAKRGFTRIDAVDLSQKSLDISASKGVYERLICDSLGKNKLKGVEDGHYSSLLCVGSLAVGQVTQDVFPEWTRIVQKGGFMVFTISKTQLSDDLQSHREIAKKMSDAVDDLVQRGVWKLIEKVDINYFGGHMAEMYTIRRL